MDAFRDYRELLKEKDENLDTSWRRSMVAAESNMNLFSKRLNCHARRGLRVKLP